MPKQNTSLAQAIYAAGKNPKQDAVSKKILSHKDIAKWILKEAIPDLSDEDPDRIKEWIGATSFQSTPVDQDVTERYDTTGTASTSKNEGNIYYDIRFPLNIERDQKQTKLLIDIEAQQNCNNLRYSLLNRAWYYAIRMGSEQKTIEFHNSDFDSQKRVYSIWLLLGPQNYVESNCILRSEHHYMQNSLNVHKEYSNYTNVVFIPIGEEVNVENKTIALLNIIFGSKPVETKLELLSQAPYHIKITQDIKKEVSSMDFYGAYREEKGRQLGREEGMQQGMQQGIQQGIQQGAFNQMLTVLCNIHKSRPDWSLEFIMNMVGVDQDKRDQYLKAFADNMKSEYHSLEK